MTFFLNQHLKEKIQNVFYQMGINTSVKTIIFTSQNKSEFFYFKLKNVTLLKFLISFKFWKRTTNRKTIFIPTIFSFFLTTTLRFYFLRGHIYILLYVSHFNCKTANSIQNLTPHLLHKNTHTTRHRVLSSFLSSNAKLWRKEQKKKVSRK